MSERLGPWLTEPYEFFFGELTAILPEGAAVNVWNPALDKVDPDEAEQATKRMDASVDDKFKLTLVPIFLQGGIRFIPRKSLTYERPESPKKIRIQKRPQAEYEAMKNVVFTDPTQKDKKLQKALF